MWKKYCRNESHLNENSLSTSVTAIWRQMELHEFCPKFMATLLFAHLSKKKMNFTAVFPWLLNFCLVQNLLVFQLKNWFSKLYPSICYETSNWSKKWLVWLWRNITFHNMLLQKNGFQFRIRRHFLLSFTYLKN